MDNVFNKSEFVCTVSKIQFPQGADASLYRMIYPHAPATASQVSVAAFAVMLMTVSFVVLEQLYKVLKLRRHFSQQDYY